MESFCRPVWILNLRTNRSTCRHYPPIICLRDAVGWRPGKLLPGGGSVDPRPEQARHMLFAEICNQPRPKLAPLMSRTSPYLFEVNTRRHLEPPYILLSLITRFCYLFSDFLTLPWHRRERGCVCYSGISCRHIYPYHHYTYIHAYMHTSTRRLYRNLTIDTSLLHYIT